MKTRIVIAMAVLAAVAMGTAAAETKYWKDKDGKITDTPVSGAERVTVKAPGAGDDTSAEGDQKAPLDEAAKDKATARAEQCSIATKRLSDYRGTGMLYEQDESGHKREITGNERVDLIVKAQRDVKDLCSETQAAQ